MIPCGAKVQLPAEPYCTESLMLCILAILNSCPTLNSQPHAQRNERGEPTSYYFWNLAPHTAHTSTNTCLRLNKLNKTLKKKGSDHSTIFHTNPSPRCVFSTANSTSTMHSLYRKMFPFVIRNWNGIALTN